MKKFLSIIMAVVMIMTIAPSAVFAGLSEDGGAYVLEEDETWDSESFEGDTTIPQIHQHTYGVWTTTKAASCTENGIQIRECIGCGYTESRQVAAKGHNYKNVTVKATASSNDSVKVKCSSCGDIKSNTTIYRPAKFTLSKTSVTYTGKAIFPAVTVKDSKGKTLKKNTDYKVAYSSNKSVGKASVKISFMGKYSGTKTLSFKINPKGTTLSKISAGNKSFTAKWKKQTTQTSGYQIRYSTSSKFSSSKTKLVSGNKTVSKTIKSLPAGKKYYVSVRTYKTVKGVKYYSAWSKAKTVKTKGKVSNTASNTSSNTVYITQTGSKYHYNKNCRGLSNANKIIPTTLSKAKAGGYTLCGYED